MRVIAGDKSLSLAEQHATVFALWEECDDSAGGFAARAAIEAEAARAFPPGNPSRAFTAAELARLNRGRSPASAPRPPADAAAGRAARQP